MALLSNLVRLTFEQQRTDRESKKKHGRPALVARSKLRYIVPNTCAVTSM